MILLYNIYGDIMKLNRKHYKVIENPRKAYFDMTTLELRQKLNMAFSKTISEDDMTGILGKYQKNKDRYKVKYIFSRNAQLQPRTYERYYVLAEVGEDDNGTYLEYALVYDRFYEPIVRISYILTVLLLIACMMFLMKKEMLDKVSAYTLSAICTATIVVVFKKSRETEEISRKTLKILEKNIKNF